MLFLWTSTFRKVMMKEFIPTVACTIFVEVSVEADNEEQALDLAEQLVSEQYVSYHADTEQYLGFDEILAFMPVDKKD